MDGDVMSKFTGNFLRGKKLRLVLVGPGGGGELGARASLIISSAMDPGVMLDARRGDVLRIVVRPGDGGGLGEPTLLVIIIDDVE